MVVRIGAPSRTLYVYDHYYYSTSYSRSGVTPWTIWSNHQPCQSSWTSIDHVHSRNATPPLFYELGLFLHPPQLPDDSQRNPACPLGHVDHDPFHGIWYILFSQNGPMQYQNGLLWRHPYHFQNNFFRYGFGYGTEIASVRISLAVLMLYCLIALLHTGFTIYTGRISTAWDLISEFVALAMGSRRPTELSNTSARIERAHVFKHRVCIAATAGVDTAQSVASCEGFEPTGKHLEPIFPSTEVANFSKVRTDPKHQIRQLLRCSASTSVVKWSCNSPGIGFSRFVSLRLVPNHMTRILLDFILDLWK